MRCLNRGWLWMITWGFTSLAIGADAPPASSAALSFDPVPARFSVTMNIPGVLTVGARYCDARGKCQMVGEHLGAIPLKGGGAANPEIGCRLNPEHELCVTNRLSVTLLARTPSGSVLARINDQNFAIAGQPWALERADGSAIGGPVMIEVEGELSPLHLELVGITKASRLEQQRAVQLRRKRSIAGVLGARGRRCDELLSVEKTSEGGEFTATCRVRGKQKVYREYVSGLD